MPDTETRLSDNRSDRATETCGSGVSRDSQIASLVLERCEQTEAYPDRHKGHEDGFFTEANEGKEGRSHFRDAEDGRVDQSQERHLVLVLERLVGLLPRVIAHRLEGSRFGACLVALANSFHHEPGRIVRQRAAPGNDPALYSSMGRT